MDAGKSIVSSRAFSSLPAAGTASLPFIGFPSRILHLFRGGSPKRDPRNRPPAASISSMFPIPDK
jgi:hypothetical protein